MFLVDFSRVVRMGKREQSFPDKRCRTDDSACALLARELKFADQGDVLRVEGEGEFARFRDRDSLSLDIEFV